MTASWKKLFSNASFWSVHKPVRTDRKGVCQVFRAAFVNTASGCSHIPGAARSVRQACRTSLPHHCACNVAPPPLPLPQHSSLLPSPSPLQAATTSACAALSANPRDQSGKQCMPFSGRCCLWLSTQTFLEPSLHPHPRLSCQDLAYLGPCLYLVLHLAYPFASGLS